MNLVIDQGNTFIKIGVFDKGKLIHFDSYNFFDEKILADTMFRQKISKVIISSVKQDYADKESVLKPIGLPNCIETIILDSSTKIPIKNNYETPKTLGKDRVAALVGASSLYPGCPKLVIDAGTAITIDFLDENNCFLGGNISPGIQTRFKALHQNTGQLPLLKTNENSPFLGLNTANAIESGVQNGVIFEIERYIEHFISLNISTKTILTGGDAYFFAKNLKNPIFVNQNLVLTGLNTILEYNV
ncbi:type III pantothenate kinase [Plebeiibacterium sediminum]|uniref:Type III pantothenate kinase n=1 Tax=Plebeiibacterium sediminum TaxID=2992112 RepID=A0AAE3SGR6_9BACT|nr:type III pantothenate kinase [Plebeiobacterium sediminum]MCW3788387.1 type III pantothenate kinase [Plebeiobacterium sediminum]